MAKRAKKSASFPVTLHYREGSYHWPEDVPFPAEDFDKDHDRRFKMEQRGPWGMLSKLTGWAETSDAGPENNYKTVTLHGDRTMSNPRESGYQQEGYVSLNGKKLSCFTSDLLIEHNKKLYKAGVLACRRPKAKVK